MRDRATQTELDDAVRARLARLATVPVDTSNLERRLRAVMAHNGPEYNRWRLPRAWRSLTAVAAAILVVVTVGLVLMNLGNTPAMAAPMDLARLHAEAIKSDSMMTVVTSVEQANRVLAGQWSDLPQLPTPTSGQLHACCIHDFMDSKVACLILRDGQTPLTMVVGRAREFRPAEGRTVERGGRKFTLHEVNGLRMAMTHQGDRFVCLMGEVSEDRLLEIAEGLRF